MRKEIIIFIISFIGISLCYNYQNILLKKNSSIHQWRQADCLSITQNYYKENLPFHKPKIHHLSDKTGNRGVASEFPILYYTIANIWKITGQKEWIFRLVNTLILFIGLLYLFRLFFDFFNKTLPSLFLSFLLFTSPIFVYYGNNFLADAPALSLVFIGWYHFYQFYKTNNNKLLIYTMCFFLIAGLLKISSLFSFFAIGGIAFFELLGLLKIKKEKLFKPIQLSYFIAVLIIIFSWYSYAISYSYNQGNSYVFLKGILPIWDLGPERINDTFSKFFSIQVPRMFNSVIHILTFGIFIFNVFKIRKIKTILITINIFLFIGIVLFFILFFQVFDIHDYYLINTLIFYLFTWFTFFTYLKYNTNWLEKTWFKTATILSLLYLIFISSVHIRHRYNVDDIIAQAGYDYLSEHDKGVFGWFQHDYKKNLQAFEDITPYLRELGIKREDVVMVLGDQSINISLYNMDQIGFTNYTNVHDFPNQVELSKSFNAKYLFVSEYKVNDFEEYKMYMKNEIGKFKNILIYKL